MKRIKLFFMSMLTVFGLTAVLGLNMKVNAATVSDNGATYVVSNGNKTAVWDFTSMTNSSTVNLSIGDEILGIIVKQGTTSLKSDTKSLCLKGGVALFPVPAGSAGTINFDNGTSNSDRYIGIAKLTGSTWDFYSDDYKMACNTENQTQTFTSDMLVKEGDNYYLPVYGSTKGDKMQDIKVKKYTITLTTGEFAATAVLRTVNVYDSSEKLLATKSVEDGQKITYAPAVWGASFEGYYTDKAMSSKFAHTTTNITADMNLYANFTPWDSSKIKEYELTTENMTDMESAGFNETGTTVLTGTIYTLLSSTSFTKSNNVACLGTGGKVSSTEKGIKIQAPSAGTVTVSLTTGGTSARNAKLLNSSSSEVTAKSGNAEWDETAANNFEVRTLVWDVEEGTYYLGGSNGMRIFTVVFTPATPEPEYTVELAQYGNSATDPTDMLYLGKVTGLTADDLADATVKLVVTVSKTGEDDKTGEVVLSTVYTSVSLKTEYGVSFAEAEGVYYVAWKITGLSEFAGYQLKVKLVVNGVESTQVTHTITVAE